MKTGTKSMVYGMVATLVFVTVQAFAQPRDRSADEPRREAGEMLLQRLTEDPELAGKLGLSEEQLSRLRDTAYALRKEHVALRAKLELAAIEQARLMTRDDVDQDALMKAVEDTGAIRTQMAKLRVRQLLAIRETLTEEQRAAVRKHMRRRFQEHRRNTGDSTRRGEWRDKMKGRRDVPQTDGAPADKPAPDVP